MLDLTAGTRGYAHVTDVVFGRGAPEDALMQLVRNARGTLEQEVHTYSSRLEDAQLDAVDNGAHVRVLASSRASIPGTISLFADGRGQARGRLHLTQYAADDTPFAGHYLHSKLTYSSHDLASGGPRAAFTNVSPTHVPATGGFGDVTGLPVTPAIDSRDREDVFVGLAGRTADAAHAVLASSESHDPLAVGAAIDDAARAGLLVSDVGAARTVLADTMRDMVDRASRRLLVLSKGVDDVDLARRIVAAHERGVPTLVVVRDLGTDAAKLLTDAHVPTVLEPWTATPMRMNVVLADDELLASTAYGWTNMVRPDQAQPGFGMLSRESGVLIGPGAIGRAITSLRSTGVGSVALRLLDEVVARPSLPGEKAGGLHGFFGGTTGAHDAARAVDELARPQGFLPIDDARKAARVHQRLS